MPVQRGLHSPFGSYLLGPLTRGTKVLQGGGGPHVQDIYVRPAQAPHRVLLMIPALPAKRGQPRKNPPASTVTDLMMFHPRFMPRLTGAHVEARFKHICRGNLQRLIHSIKCTK